MVARQAPKGKGKEEEYKTGGTDDEDSITLAVTEGPVPLGRGGNKGLWWFGIQSSGRGAAGDRHLLTKEGGGAKRLLLNWRGSKKSPLSQSLGGW